MLKKILLPVSLLSLFSCDDDKRTPITDGKVYSELVVRYDKNTNKTSASAAFWDGSRSGKRLIFHGDATITFQDVPMDYRSVDYTYIKELNNYQSPAIFRFVDVNNKEFVNTATINTIDFPIIQPLDTIDSSIPLIVQWTGSALENLEKVSLRIETIGTTQDTTGRTSITFSSADFLQLSSFKNNTVTVTLERSKSPGLPNDLGGGGTITSQYITLSKTAYLK